MLPRHPGLDGTRMRSLKNFAKLAMTRSQRLALITIAGTLALLGLAIIARGGPAEFLSRPPLIALVIATVALTVVALFSSANLSSGEREEPGHGLLTTRIYRVIRHPSYRRPHPGARTLAALAVRRRIPRLPWPDVAPDPRLLLGTARRQPGVERRPYAACISSSASSYTDMFLPNEIAAAWQPHTRCIQRHGSRVLWNSSTTAWWCLKACISVKLS